MIKEYPKVWILILTWNNYEDTFKCFKSLKNIDYPNFDVLVIDNNSTDGSIQLLQSKYPHFDYIKNQENLKFSGGNDIGIKTILDMPEESDYILLLNNDTIIEDKRILYPLVKLLEENPRIGIAGVKAIYPDGSNQTDDFLLRFPSIYTFITRNSFIGGVYNKLKRLINKKQCKQDCIKVDWVPVAISLIRAKVFEKCIFDEKNFPMEFSDVDFCKQISTNGYDIYYCPNLTIIHRNGFPNADIKLNRNFLRAKISEIRYIRKYFSNIYTFFYKVLNFFNSLLYVFFLLPIMLHPKFYLLAKLKIKNHFVLLIKIWTM
ncbi:MAG: glycosyltransferase family 2 protein [Candidatus Pacebacteria bacterium]|nr:glycosyltransferase family 2 protein [Candidatus Paceibacterota bacterium]